MKAMAGRTVCCDELAGLDQYVMASLGGHQRASICHDRLCCIGSNIRAYASDVPLSSSCDACIFKRESSHE